MRRTLRGVVLLLLTLLLVSVGVVLGLFLLRNAQWVVVRVPTLSLNLSDPVAMVEYETPLSVALLIACGVGVMVTMLGLIPAWLRRVVELRRERRFVDSLEGELSDLRNLPLTAPAPLEDREPTRKKGRGRRGKGAPVDDDDLLASVLGDDTGPGR